MDILECALSSRTDSRPSQKTPSAINASQLSCTESNWPAESVALASRLPRPANSLNGTSINDEGENPCLLELMPLLKEPSLLITVARLNDKLKVNVIPAKIKDGEDQALTTPLSYTGSAEELDRELDRELGKHLAGYVDTHLTLGSTLVEAKAEMDAAAKAARQKAKAIQVLKTEAASAKKAEPTTSTAVPADPTPSLFSAEPQSTQPPVSAPEEERKTS